MALQIISEIHPQHGGSMPVIRELIRQSKSGGADAVKVQLYDATKLLGEDWNYLTLTREAAAQIKRWCDEEEIEFLASVFDEQRLDWCLEFGVERLKIASITLKNDKPLADRIVDTGKPVIASLGHWHEPTLPYGSSDRVTYLYCKSKYPAFLEDMTHFPERFSRDELAGYSDHTLGIGVCLLAISRGASIIEKHMTLSKALSKRTEQAHICSMDVSELAELRRIGGELHRVYQALPTLAHA